MEARVSRNMDNPGTASASTPRWHVALLTPLTNEGDRGLPPAPFRGEARRLHRLVAKRR